MDLSTFKMEMVVKTRKPSKQTFTIPGKRET
jgi:hypothetical protein